MNRRLFVILFFFFLIDISFAAKSRGLWVVRYALLEEEEIEHIINSALILKITDLYVQVRASGKLFFQQENNLTHLITNSAAKNFLRLQKKAAHHKIKVHAWLNILNIWSSAKKPINAEHLFYISHGSVLRRWVDKTTDITALRKMGIEGYFIDPADPGNFKNLKRIIKLLVEKYNVDGIHLDYFRYPSLQVTSSPSMRTRFILQEYIDPEKIYIPWDKKQSDQISYFAEMNIAYKSFLLKSLTNLLANIQLYVNSFPQKIELSIAVKPTPVLAKSNYFQDWAAWLERDLCDKIITMNYAPEAKRFNENLNACSTLNKNNKIIIGISTYNQDENGVLQKIKTVINNNFAGYALFSYNSLQERKMLTNLGLNISAQGDFLRK